MLDPSSTIGLAASIVQLLTFASGLLQKSKQIYKSVDGSTDANNDLEIITRTLIELSNEISTKRDESCLKIGLMGGQSKTEEELQQLCNGSREVSASLLAALEKLKRGEGNRHWQSFRQALRFVWNESKINALAAKIEKYRRQIDTALLVSLREKIDRLESSAVPSFNSTISIQVLGPVHASKLWQADLVNSTYRNKWQPGQQNDLKSFSEMLSELSAEQRFHVLTDRILDMINFTEMRDRYEAIPEAYRKTFEWVFQDPDENNTNNGTMLKLKESDSFVKWLQSPQAIYWITGKPGSGKSTLMKYLYGHPNMKSNLLLWHQEHPLVMAGFFFWNSGTQVQMSQVGLLRSLLYQVLASHRELFPLAFPKRLEAFQLIGDDPEPLSWLELATGLKAIVNDTTKRFVFFVDGLDEYNGNPAELAQLITDLSCNENVKVCASSRPWLVFEEAFSSKPWLRLESLTYSDISFFVKDKMESSRMFATIRTVKLESADALIHEVTERASGVFLWVHIVVNSLLEGLRDGDTIEELQGRLHALPSDLEELFRKILHRLNPFYFKQSCEVFLLHRAAGLPITLLDLALAREGCDKALSAPVRPFTELELEYYAENMRRFLNSRCKGLLEAPEVEVKKHDAKVQYLHRTVRDFFQQQSVLEYIESGTLKNFDPVLLLSAAYLARVKSIQPGAKLSMVHDFWTVFFLAIHNARQIKSQETHVLFLNELDKTSTQLWAQKTETRSGEMTWLQVIVLQTVPERALFNSSTPLGKEDSTGNLFWGNTQIHITDDIYDLTGLPKRRDWYPHPLASFFELAVQFNLHRYVTTRLDQDVPITYTINGQTLSEVCDVLKYDDLKNDLIRRKCPGSGQETCESSNVQSGKTTTKWYKRFSKARVPSKT